MGYDIKRVVVIGAGTMGRGIAALAAGAGLRVGLLDLVPEELTEEEHGRGLTLASPAVRNRLATEAVERLRRAQPPAFPEPSAAELLTVGNVEDDFAQVAEADWIVEAVVERLEPKRELLARIERARRPGSVVSSNTSGLPIAALAAHTSADFKAHFLGTHFFNPPYFMPLLEVIPARETEAEVVRFVADFASRRLQKGVVLCKDTPNFIANRLASVSAATALAYVLRHGYTVEEADAVLGPAVGRPKTALFRLQDLVGLDVAGQVGENLYDLIPHDESREVLRDPKVAALRAAQIERGRLGDKTGQGFYLKPPGGAKGDILTLDLETLEYRPRREPDLPSVKAALKIAPTAERISFLLAQDDRAGALARHAVYNSLAYAARRVPEITDQIVNVDRAMRWGYSHELGPFELWDALGVGQTAAAMEAYGVGVEPWVEEMLAAGRETFYRRDSGLLTFYDPARGAYVSEDEPRGEAA